MISNLKNADIEIWGMVDEVHSVCPASILAANYVTRSWETGISRVERRIPYLFRPSTVGPNQTSTVVSSQSSQRVHCAELGRKTVFATVP
jgi:hypothetical protein